MKSSAKNTALFHLFKKNIHLNICSLIDKISIFYLMSLLVLIIHVIPDSKNAISALNC